MQAKPIRNERPDQTFDDEFGETEYLKTEKSPKIEVQGNKDNMNLIGPVLIAILSSDYFKSLSELKSFSPVITEIERSVTDLEPFGSLNIASKCFCLMFKLFKNKLTERQMEAMLSNYESVYVRAMGLLYLRLCGPFKDLYDWFEPHFSDDEEFNTARTATKMTTLGEYAKKLLTEQKHFSILLPRIPVMIQRAINDNIKQWNIDNNVKSADDDKYKVKERNRGHSPDPRLEEIREEKARRERSEDRAYEKDTRDERRRDERDRRDDRDRREEDRGRDRYRDDRDRRRDDRRDDRDRDRKDDRERRDDRRDERDRRDDRDRYRRDEREDRYRDDRDRRERREDRDRDDESRRRADRDRRDERRDDRDRDRKDNKRSPSPRGSPQPGETKKPKVDMQKLMDIYGPSDSSQKYNANPTLGATEVVRIGFGKY